MRTAIGAQPPLIPPNTMSTTPVRHRAATLGCLGRDDYETLALNQPALRLTGSGFSGGDAHTSRAAGLKESWSRRAVLTPVTILLAMNKFIETRKGLKRDDSQPP